MISRSNLYERKNPDKEAKLFIIFCEGEKTEPNYFKYFNGIVSQVKIITVPHVDGDNSPEGLYKGACKAILKSDENHSPLYEINDDDEIWFVIDTDQWGEKIDILRESCDGHANWQIAQSNPCFEVWLHYHFLDEPAEFPDLHVSRNWKQHLNSLTGGFNYKKHAIFIEKALKNSKANYADNVGKPHIGSTQVFMIAEKLMPIVKKQIDAALTAINDFKNDGK